MPKPTHCKCGAEREPGITRVACRECYNAMQLAWQKTYAAKKAGKCIDCGQQLKSPTAKRCVIHAARQNFGTVGVQAPIQYVPPPVTDVVRVRRIPPADAPIEEKLQHPEWQRLYRDLGRPNG